MTFSGPEDDRPYIAALTGLRGIAAFLVFLFHYAALHPGIRLDLAVPLVGGALQFPFGLGFSGVDIFFVLSGFLLTLPFARAVLAGTPPPSTGRYFQRRLRRVLPAYYAQLFIILFVGAWFLAWKPQTIGALFAHLLMFFNIGWNPVTPLVGVWWTLPVEMGFYLLLPLLAPLLYPRRWIPVLVVAVVLSMVYRYWAGTAFAHLGEGRAFLMASQLPGCLTEFMLGCSGALLVQFFAITNKPRPPAWLLDTLFLSAGVLFVVWLGQVVVTFGDIYWFGHWSMVIAPLALGIPISLCVLSLYWGSRIGKLVCANRVVYFLGLISYSLYLWHFVVMQQLQALVGGGYGDLPHWVKFPLATSAVLLVATISYFLAERPFYRLKRDRPGAPA